MKMSVVILETDPLIESMVLDCVGESQADVEMMSEMHAAREFVESQDVSLVVLNADLPKGWRFCTELKKDPKTSHIPLVILSEKATDDVFHDHQKLPTRADAYLKKPVLIDQFRLAILAVLKGELFELDVDVDLGIETPEITEVNVVEESSSANVSQQVPNPPPATVPEPPAPSPFTPPKQLAEEELEEILPSGPDPFLEPVVDPFLASDEPSIGLEPDFMSHGASPSTPAAPKPPEPAANPIEIPPPPAMESVASTASPIPIEVDPSDLTEISQERDFLKAKVDELSQTGRALESAHKGQAQETELLRRQIEALQAERDVLEETKKRLTSDLEFSQRAQTDLKSALQSARQPASGVAGDDTSYVLALETHIDELHTAFAQMSQQASNTDIELRTALASYQEREAALTQMRDSENRLTDTLLAVVEHVYEGLDLLRQDIHNGVPELPELGDLPPLPDGVPAPFAQPNLPPRPSRSGTIAAPAPASLPSAPPEVEYGALPTPPQVETSAEFNDALSVPPDSLVGELSNGEAASESLDLPLAAPFEAPSMDFDDLTNLEALVQKAPTSGTQDPSLNVAGAPLLDPELLDEFGADPTKGAERDIPFEA